MSFATTPASEEGLQPANLLDAPAAAKAAVRRGGHRLAFLDVIRAVAAFAVAFQHLAEGAYPYFRVVVGRWINLGELGVVAFFLVSGFVIPSSLQKLGSLGSFWRGRVARLYPMYWLVLAAAMVASWSTGKSVLAACAHPALCFAANASMLQGLTRVPAVLDVAWTLSLEMVFYILCSIIFRSGFLKHSVALAAGAAGIILLTSTAGIVLHRSLPEGRLGLLAICFYGTVIYRVYSGEARPRALWVGGLLGAALLEGFWLRFHLYPAAPLTGMLPITFACSVISWTGGFAVFFALFACRQWQMPAALAWLGRLSYSFYLLSGFIPGLIPGTMYPPLRIALCLGLCTLVSAMTYRWIELPTMALGKRKPGGVPVQNAQQA